ncbi:MAG: ThiF family adenylyltransferase [Candidatus Thermoplasmatota archaeon]|jgi:molybdopterin/thiamine biosynthesis adenylyltransferase|nr:ThiF family adenylyltransferase [Candidatus Thermoplasmatota archaeon]MDP7264612.1 ThiF family adenylyltransferase [Candidatus Thermoplasmatota archaeon]
MTDIKEGNNKGNKGVVLRADRLNEDKLERSKRIGVLDIEAISRAKVLVVGLGAIGNETVKNLVLSGFTHFTLVDMDYIVRSNLNRCVFFRDIDANQKSLKTEVVGKAAKELDPDIDVTIHTAKIQDLGDDFIPRFDLIFGCLDNIDARLHINAHSYYNKIPYIDAATNGFIGKVQVILPPETPCLECTMNKTHYAILQKRFSCTGADITYFEDKMAAEITTTAVVSAIQVREGLKIISGKREKCLKNIFYYHGINNMSDELELELNPDCLHHMH